jgi:hypothetical protein
MRKMIGAAALLAMAFLAAGPRDASAADLITLKTPLVDPDTPENRALVTGVLEKAAAAVNHLYATELTLSAAETGAAGQFSLAAVAALSPQSPAMVLKLTRVSDGTESPSYPLLGAVTPETPPVIARAVYLLWSSYNRYFAAALQQPPVLVDELSTEMISPMATPMSLTVRPGSGTLVAAMATQCVELDSSLRVVDEPGRKLRESGSYTFAGAVSATPAGTLLLKPTMGKDLYRIGAGDGEPRRVPVGTELSTMLFTALPDGNALFVDMVNRKAFRTQGRKRVELSLFTTAYATITAVSASPDGTVWVWDVLQKGIRIYTPEGSPVDAILPLVDPSSPISPTSLSVGTDGSFVVLSSGLLSKFSRDGKPVWKMDAIPGADDETIPRAGSVAVDWGRGIIYLSDMSGRRIVKLLDTAYCRQKGITNPLEEKVVALAALTDEAASLAQRARLYEGVGSLMLARSAWQKLQDAAPGNQEAASHLRALELVELRQTAADLDARTRALLKELGPESARLAFTQAAQKYEGILARDPGDNASRSAYEELKRLFAAGEEGPSRQKRPIIITEVKLPNLFPSLMQYYSANGAGTVTMKNPLDVDVRDLRVSVFIPRFMDLPTPSRTVPLLKAGDAVTVSVKLTLSPAVLELQEDMPVQARVDAAWTAAGEAGSTGTVAPVTLYRKSALTWDDTRKIASFITPNEEVVSDFAHRVLAGGVESGLRLSPRFLRAARIIDALAAYGIGYVEDPDAPISRTLGKTEAVDTVRFARNTLANRSGDCDDTTALLASLLESAGVRTAILTTPGHIFMAFDSGEPADNAGLLAAPGLEVIPSAGQAWIPVETTVVSGGFMAAWRAASDLVRKHRAAGPFEFLPVRDAWDSYPPLPLPPSTVTIVEPPAAAVNRLSAVTIGGLERSLYAERIAELDGKLTGLSGRQAARLLNQQGILHALFGRTVEAARAFSAATTAAPASAAGYANLANLKVLGKDIDGALEVVKTGLAKTSSSAALNLLAARCYAGKGDRRRAEEHFRLAREMEPQLAERYAAILGAEAGGTGRAAEAGSAPAVIWTGEE